MAAPKVQSVEAIVKSLNPAYKGSIDVVNKRRSQLPGMFDAQRSALGAEKVQGFNQINNQATSRGMSFSGIPLDEQATYLSTKYLPGLQQLDQQQNDQNLALDEALAGINKERRLSAMDIRQTQQKTLQDYLSEQRQMKWEREKFKAQQAMDRAKMAQQASIAAANRAAKTSGRNIEIKKQKGGGWDVIVDGKKGQMDLASAAKATGQSVLSLLANGSSSDLAAYSKYVSMGGGEKGSSYLRNNTGAFYLGGGF